MLTEPQFAPRPGGFQCPSATKIKSYCDAADPYCCTGNDQNTHQGYGTKYGQQALAFINSQLTSSGGGTTPTTTASGGGATTVPGGAVVPKWGQCGGQGYSGSTTCVSGTTCQVANQWYSQCL